MTRSGSKRNVKEREKEERAKVSDYNGQYLSPEPTFFVKRCSFTINLIFFKPQAVQLLIYRRLRQPVKLDKFHSGTFVENIFNMFDDLSAVNY